MRGIRCCDRFGASGTSGFDGQGLYGGPRKAHAYGDWIAAYYHELNQTEYTNIVWSNGQLDPWSGGGHYATPGGITVPHPPSLPLHDSSPASPRARHCAPVTSLAVDRVL